MGFGDAFGSEMGEGCAQIVIFDIIMLVALALPRSRG